MTLTSRSRPTIRFGVFEFDADSRQVRKQGKRVRLEPKLYQVLELLLLNAGKVVARKRLRETLWPNTHVAFAHNLNTAVNKLRKLLGDTARNPRFIETLPRVGYRFLAPVKTLPHRPVESGREMLMVLPFENLGDRPEHAYFADGLTQEVIAHLGGLNPRQLGVIARASAAQYKVRNKTVAEMASELGVSYVLEGTVRGDGTSVRVAIQLIDAQQQTQLWASSYDRPLRDLLNTQADLARQIGAALTTTLSCESSLVQPFPPLRRDAAAST